MARHPGIALKLLGLCCLPGALVIAACGGGYLAEEEAIVAREHLESGTSEAIANVDPPQVLDLRGYVGPGPLPTTSALSYSASNTYSATMNTTDFYFNLPPGATITIGTCGLEGASGHGDTYLRFYNSSGTQVDANDDNCTTYLSSFTYTSPSGGMHVLRAGCYSTGSCSGTLSYRLSGVLPYYAASATNNATVNTTDFYLRLSAGEVATFGTCGLEGATGTGDTYLRFYDPSGTQVTSNDDACGGLRSKLFHTTTASGTYLLRAGCFSNGSCGGTIAYTVVPAHTEWDSLLCTGRTPPGATNWRQYSADGLYLDVDTSSCGFSSTPLYLTSLAGVTDFWVTTGATSIYSPTATGFRVYVRHPSSITPQYANQSGWHLNWFARP